MAMTCMRLAAGQALPLCGSGSGQQAAGGPIRPARACRLFHQLFYRPSCSYGGAYSRCKRAAPPRAPCTLARRPAQLRPSVPGSTAVLPQRLQARRSHVASSGGSGGGGGLPPAPVQQLVSSPLYRIWAQLGVVLVLLMGVDAGWSGDWSRIGALSTDQEAAVRQVRAVVRPRSVRSLLLKGAPPRFVLPPQLCTTPSSAQLMLWLGAFHLACGAAAAAICSRRGEAWAPRVAKVLAVGFLALMEVALLPAEEAES